MKSRVLGRAVSDLLRACACLLLLAHGAAAAQAISPEELAALVRQQDAKVESLSCSFTQTTTAPMFAAPLRSSGRLVFRAPESLRWEYLEPVEQGFILAEGRVIRWESGGARVSAPAERDPLGMFLGRQLLAWVKADTEMIGRDYEVTLIARDPLEFSLTPRSAAARDVVRELRLRFTAEGIASSVQLTETGGGVTRLDFFDVRRNEPLSPSAFD